MSSPPDPAAVNLRASGDYFGPDQIAARQEQRTQAVEAAAPIAGAAVEAVVTAALAIAPHPVAQVAAPLAGAVAGESAQSASKVACGALVIPGAAAAERGSGKVRDEIDKKC